MTKRMLIVFLCAMPVVAGTPAESAIQKAQAEIARRPDYFGGYNDLAMAMARRARETSDVQYYGKAEEMLRKSFSLSPDNFGGLKVEAWLLLGRHEFAKAREVATKLNKRTPDDVTVYGYLADANAELGNYQEAVEAAQWMLNLRPGNVPGLTRAAYLRELHGDYSGAIELMQQAYDSTPSQELEDRAWLLTQMAHLNLSSGELTEAERFATGALGLFADYHYALGTLGQIRMAQRRYGDAAELFQKRYDAAPHAENLFSLGEALERAGQHAEAARAFAEFEKKALVEAVSADNANHELVAYYNDYAHQPNKALRVAEEELARRHDAFTLDAHAWSLAGLGDYARARAEMQKALAFGLKDPKVMAHARAIAQQNGAAE
ncbi:MAG TPA: tetratricopeptide repeat protein [Bryobacteraceae bacterium]|nr:tetratricopeptide repeat protein [Bryobacteraceae bacterium]